MSTNTTNYNLKKPATTDFYDVSDQNGNMDIIDSAMKNLKDLNDGKEALLKNATEKSAPVDADTVPLTDSADGSKTKKLSWANLKAAIIAYFNSVTATLTNKTLISPTINEETTANLTVFTLNNPIANNNNVHLFYKVAGVIRGLLYLSSASNAMALRVYDANGAYPKDLVIGNDGTFTWSNVPVVTTTAGQTLSNKTFSNTISVTGSPAQMQLNHTASGDPSIYMYSNSVIRGIMYTNVVNSSLRIGVYNSTGSSKKDLVLYNSGAIEWDGNKVLTEVRSAGDCKVLNDTSTRTATPSSFFASLYRITFKATSLRVSFQLKSSNSSYTATAKLRLSNGGTDGPVLGTIRSTNSTTFVTYTEDIVANFVPGSAIDLELSTTGGTASVFLFTISLDYSGYVY